MTAWTGKHGRTAYHTGKCRCDVCRKDANRYANKARTRRYRNGPPADVEHGRSCYVNWGCRCQICYDAQSEYNRNYKQKETAT